MQEMLSKMLNLVRIKCIVFIQFYFICVSLFDLSSALYLNDDCIVSRTAENGTCKFVDDCPQIVMEVMEQSKYPTLCGFERMKQIICCPNPITANQINMPTKASSSRISAEKCVEYQSTCSSNSILFNNVSGDAAPKEFPYDAALGLVDKGDPSERIIWGCGGSVISEYFVLTIAGCIRSSSKWKLLYVRLGDLNTESDTDDIGVRQYKVIETFRYPLFDDQTFYNEIALIKVDGPIGFTDYIRPACLPDINTIISEHLIVAGRGEEYNRTHLQRIPLKLVSHAECSNYYVSRTDSNSLYKGIENKTQICAGSSLGESDACEDFGGYALINTNQKHSCLHEIVGIFSFNVACGIGTPNVYTRISAYLDWIEDIVWLGGNGNSIITKPDEGTIIEPPPLTRTSSKKCRGYYDTLTQSLADPSECPLSIHSYIVDGEDAVSAKEFPHMALIGFDSSSNSIWWGCGGSLISEYFVLTAAHCLYSKHVGHAKYVLLGDVDYADDDDDADPHRFNVVERIKHPEFLSRLKYHDIGLLRLESAVSFDEYIRPVCLPETGSIDFSAIATGWGQLSYNRSTTTHLQKVKLDLYTHDECNRLYTLLHSRSINKGIANDTQICAGNHGRSHGDTCHGDSGGPLQISHNRYKCMRTVVGITSFGALCGSRYPSIYTRVFSYIDWIENIVWPELTDVNGN